MKQTLRIAIFSIITIILLVAVVNFIIKIKNRSLPPNYLELEIDSIDSEVDIYINQHNIAHIISPNDEDVFFGVGYIHARSKLWEMCIDKQIAKGRAAEIVGDLYLHSDFYMRTIGLDIIAKTLYENSDDKTKKILQKYTAGVNTYIRENRNKLSVEFAANDYIPDDWEPEDCFLIQRFFAFRLSSGFISDVVMGEIAGKIGVKKALTLVPNYSQYASFVLDENINIRKKDSLQSLDSSSQEPHENNMSPDLDVFFNEINSFDGRYGTNIRSNCWAVFKNNEKKSTVVFANDMYTQLIHPSIFQQLHISSPNYNVVGMTIPGMPIFLTARNNNIAWGITNMMLDDVDLFVEKLDDKNENYFINDVETKPITERLDTIKIKNAEEKVFYIRSTETSPIISDFHILSKNSYNSRAPKARKLPNNKAITFRWCGSQISNEIQVGLQLMLADNWNDFLISVNNWSTPGIVFSYADKDGNIGLAPRGIVPQRGVANIPTLPSPAWKSGTNWLGFYPANAFSVLYNPPKAFISSANNAVMRNIKYYISSYWDAPSRANRIEEVLAGGEYFSARDAQYLQNDVFSDYVRGHLLKIIHIFGKYEHLLTKQEKKAYYKLLHWDYIMATNSTTSSIYNLFLSKLVYNTFADELGGNLYEAYTNLTNFYLQKIYELSDYSLDAWFDDAKTSNQEHLEYLVILSFKEAVAELTEIYGTSNSDKWQYGKLHTLSMNNIYIHNKNLFKAPPIGKFELGGNSTTLNCTDWKLKDPFKVVSAAAMRFVADMRDSVVYTILAGGNSSDAISPNYSDQLQLWHIGAYLSVPVGEVPSSEFELKLKFINK